MKKLLLVAIMGAVAMTGCFKHTYTVGEGGNTSAEPTYSEWQSHWFFGLIGNGNVDVKAICPSGNVTIKDYHSFVNLLISTFTRIVWYPTTVEVYCAEPGPPKSASITLTPAQMTRIAKASLTIGEP